MSNPNKAKGTRWETDVVNYLREIGGLHVVKPRQEGAQDIGDIHVYNYRGITVIQAKNWASWESAIREGLDGAVKQAAALSHTAPLGTEPFPVAVVKRARKSTGEAYVVTRLEDFVELLKG